MHGMTHVQYMINTNLTHIQEIFESINISKCVALLYNCTNSVKLTEPYLLIIKGWNVTFSSKCIWYCGND